MKTIKQIADEIGVSKTAVRKKIANLGLQSSLRKKGIHFSIGEEQERLIKSEFLKNETQTVNENLVCDKAESLHLVSDVVSTLQEQLREKDRQIQQQQQSIKELTAALENTTASLKAAQALHAGTMQQNLLAEKEEAEPIENEKQKKWYEFWR